jgi:endonuclease/exonuclease/phosphatase (EEP) superfamily protein YafD
MSAPPRRLSADGPPSTTARRSRGTRHLLPAALLTGALTVVTLPDLLRIDRYSPFAQLVAFRPLAAAGVAGLAATAVVGTLLRRRLWPYAAGTAVVALVAAGLVLSRAVAAPPPDGGRPLTVMTFNTFEGAADVEAVARLVRSAGPDLVAIIEAGESYRSRLAPLVEPLGYRLHTSTPAGRPDVVGVTAMATRELGDLRVQIGEDSAFAWVQLDGGELGDLRFVAYHSVAPTPGAVPRWRADLDLLARWCAGGTPAVVAGDLNATLDHSVLRRAIRGCSDAAAQTGAGLTATWPTVLPRWLGTQIDHVIATEGIRAETFDVVDVPGSDHRAIVSRLRLPE